MTFLAAATAAERPEVITFFQVSAQLKDAYGRWMPADADAKTMADLGVTAFFLDGQIGYGGPFWYPTKVNNTLICRQYMPEGRDYLKETLEAAGSNNVHEVWLLLTPPNRNTPNNGGMYAFTNVALNSPDVKRVYRDIIDEVARDYAPKYTNFAGFFWHETHCGQIVNETPADIAEFSAFCQREFGAAYPGAAVPAVNPGDVWWRRYYLFRNAVMTDFIGDMAQHARRHNLKTGYCLYPPESSVGWGMGVDIVALEKICDRLWVLTGFNAKPYYSMRGMWLDFGPSYGGQWLPVSFAQIFHGRPISFFEHVTPVYVPEINRVMQTPGWKTWRDKYGDYYLDYKGHTQKEVDLFFGRENMTKWLKLGGAWQGGRSVAQVAVAVAPVPFLMTHPLDYQAAFKACYSDLIMELSKSMAVDAFAIGALNMAETMKGYDLVIIPKDMALGLSETTFKTIRNYVEQGGKLLVVNTPLQLAGKDLAGGKDVTTGLCGARIAGTNLGGNICLTGENPDLTMAGAKIRAATSRLNLDGGAKALAQNKDSGEAILTRFNIGKGEVLLAAIDFNPEVAPWFTAIVKTRISLGLSLDQSTGLTLLDAVKKNGAVCIATTGKGTARLAIVPRRLGLEGKPLLVKDIITGAVIKPQSGDDASGYALAIGPRYEGQPYVLAAGTAEALKEYQGIYPSADAFQGIATRKAIVENPQVPIIEPAGAGPRIGIYHRGDEAPFIQEALKNQKLRAFSLLRMDTEGLTHADVIVIPQMLVTSFMHDAKDRLRAFVEAGGGVLLSHDAVGYRAHQPLFPEIGKGKVNAKLNTIVVGKEHPVTAGLPRQPFVHAFQFDHIAIEPGIAGEVLLNDESGNPVVVAGKLGKGKVVLCGVSLGAAGERNSSSGHGQTPAGNDLILLLNIVNWLGSKP